jgi:hypothetical protein
MSYNKHSLAFYHRSFFSYIYICVCVCVFTCIYKFANDVFDDDGLSRRLAHLSS